MTTDPILDELHEVRRRLLMEAGGTLEGLVAGLRKRQQESGRRILSTQGADRLDEPQVVDGGFVAATPKSRERKSDSGSDR